MADPAPESPLPAGPADLEHWLTLARAPGLDGGCLPALLARYAGPRDICRERPVVLAGLGVPEAALRGLEAPDRGSIEADLAWLAGPRRHLVPFGSPRYPARLAELPDPPVALFVEGDPDLLGDPQIAVVGSRHPTPTGGETTFAFARALARAGLVVTSGLAYGVDGAAHRGALAAGGVTLAVAGNGLDRTYPRAHRELARAVVEAGALVSELPTGAPPRREHFPRRNRIISGLALGVLVVEAAKRSGSLITARLAAEQGREVFAIPGSIHNPLARGCHALIRQGAKLVESVEEVLLEIAPQLRDPAAASTPVPTAAGRSAPQGGLDEEYLHLLDAMGHEPVPVDLLVVRTRLTPQVVSSMLLSLEMRGYVTSMPGAVYSRSSQEDFR